MASAKETVKNYLGDYRKTWRTYSKERRRLFKVSAASGVAILMIGIAGDVFNWWTRLGFSFTPNAMNSLAGFLIGVPIALILLSTITSEREEKSQRDKVDALSNSSWRSFAARVYSYCSPYRRQALGYRVSALNSRWDNMRTRVLEIMGPTLNEAPRPSDEVLDALVSEFSAGAEEMEDMLREMGEVWPSGETLTMEWVAIVGAWTLLDEYVKIQRSECGLDEWIPEGAETQIQQKMLHEPTEVADFSALHDESYLRASPLSLRTDLTSPYFGMRDIPAFLRSLACGGRDRVYEALRDKNSPFYMLPGNTYSSAAQRAIGFLTDLGSAVYAAESAEGWPATAKVWSPDQQSKKPPGLNQSLSERMSNMMIFMAVTSFAEPQSQSDNPDH